MRGGGASLQMKEELKNRIRENDMEMQAEEKML